MRVHTNVVSLLPQTEQDAIVVDYDQLRRDRAIAAFLAENKAVILRPVTERERKIMRANTLSGVDDHHYVVVDQTGICLAYFPDLKVAHQVVAIEWGKELHVSA